MISVVIPTLNAERGLAATLAALVPAMVDGVVRQVIISDGGSADRTVLIAEDAGADVVTSVPCRGGQLATGADAARFPWLLFLHADTVLDDEWSREALGFIKAVEEGRRPVSAAAFRFALDDRGAAPRFLEKAVGLRCALFRLPYGDQGLLMPASFYRELGGFKALPLMEDVDMIGQIGRRRLVMLQTRAVTSSERYRRDGYMMRSVRNLTCLFLFMVGVPPRRIVGIYDKRGARAPGSENRP